MAAPSFRDEIKAYADERWMIPCKDNMVWVYYAGINTQAEIRNKGLSPAEWAAAFLLYDDPTYGKLEGLYLIKTTSLASVKAGNLDANSYPGRTMISSWYDLKDKNGANPEVIAQKPKCNGLNDCAHFVTESLAAGGINVRTTGVPQLLGMLRGLADTKTLALTVAVDAAERIVKAGIMDVGDVIIYSLTPTDHHHSVVYMGGEKIAMHTWANHPRHPTRQGDWKASASEDHPLVTLIHFGRDDGIPAAGTWLSGWWQVLWRGTTYYYYFDAKGHVGYTKQAPANTSQPLYSPESRGYWFQIGFNIKNCWTRTGSLEVFTILPPTARDYMEGTWNGTEPLVADKM